MHRNAADKPRLDYAALLGQGSSLACHRVKLLMAALMILGMTTQAQASIEQVAPHSSACFSSSQNIGCAPSVQFAANNACSSVGGGSAINMIRIDFTTWSTDCQLGGTFRIIGSVSCPVPTVNPTVPYSYNANTSMCEREQQVQYTIALHNLNLGGELAPNASRAAYAEVMNGTIPIGIAVTLTTTAPPEAGSGMLSPANGSTGGDGKLNFSFTAPPVGGTYTHTVTATCDGGKCSNAATGTIVVTACPVKDLTPLDKLSKQFNETPEQIDLTNKLESGVDGYSLLSDATKTAEQCLARRVNAVVGVTSGYKVTSTVRTLAYQKHLREVWDKFWDLQKRVKKDPTIQQTCQTLIAKVEGEMGLRLTQDPQIVKPHPKLSTHQRPIFSTFSVF